MSKIDKIISIIRSLKEEAATSGPTNTAGPSGLGFDPQKESPPVFRKKYAYLGKNSRARWMQRRNFPSA